jgi:hypothetical protein
MFRLWIIEKDKDNYQLFWNSDKYSTYEPLFIINKHLLIDFTKEWEIFIHRIYPLKKLKTKSDWEREVIPQFYQKSQLLSNILFQDHYEVFIKTILNHTKILFILEQEISNLPLEILIYKEKSNNDFDCLYQNFKIFRQIRINPTKIKNSYKNNSNNFMIYIQDINLSYVHKELNSLLDILKKNHIPKLLINNNITKIKFLEKLTNSKYFHFIGHMSKNEIILNQEIIKKEEIESLNLSNLKIVFLNSCKSTYQNDDISYLAKSFIIAGTKHIVGFQNIIDDEIAEFISSSFWKSYFRNLQPIEDIIYEIKQTIINEKGKLEPALFLLQYYGTSEKEIPYNKKSYKIKKQHLLTLLLFLLIFIGTFFIPIFFTPQIQKEAFRTNTTKKENPSQLEKTIERFLSTPHPFYDLQEKRKIIKEILGKNITENEKIKLIENEIYH